ncbi:response regulator transcription factor [Paenibacillus cymbidii]|uniref:response regulator transcription factor n=1 Tax=Paenibacillus cymbidii TaxID=1639034 RepID=UPI0010818BBA|nr:response regulator [Paenibacillus cymbidii]
MYRVLIVDDETSIRKGLGILIDWNDYGFQVAGEAANGLEALRMIQKERYDVLVSDIRMPLMNGLELSQQIYEMGLDTKVILVSGYRDFEYARTAIEFGVANYVLKPINEEILIRALTKIRKQYESAKNGEDGLPGEEYGAATAAGDPEIVRHIEYYVQQNCGGNITLIEVAKQFNYNHVYLGRLFFRAKGESFRNYLNQVRVKKAEKLICEGKYKLYEVSEKVGYKDFNYFCKIFKKITGFTPGEYTASKHQV